MKRPAILVRALSALLMAGAFGCSLIVDASDVDAGCPDWQKFCDGMCVDIADPAYGCGPTQCGQPCTLEHATARCEDLTCMVEFCEYGFGCPAETLGCRTEVLSDPDNCGYCGHECDPEEVCENGECKANAQ